MADGSTLKPLTVAEIVAFQPPANLAGWKLTQDTAGGYSYRAAIGDVSYIATPKQWEGRIMAQTVNSAATGINYGLNLQSLHNEMADSIRTNSGTFRPEGAENVTLNGTAAVPPGAACDPPVAVGGSYDHLLLPGALLIAAGIYYITGKRKA